LSASLPFFGGLTFSNPPVGLRMDPSSLSCDPVNLTSFQMEAMTSALVPSFIPTRLERGSRTLNLCGKWSMCRTTRHSTFLSPLRRISNPSRWFVRFWGCHWLLVPVTNDREATYLDDVALWISWCFPIPKIDNSRLDE
jgi:hypothetical protein